MYGQNVILRKVVISGADVNKTDDEGKTPLFHAVVKSNRHTALALIDAGADVNKTDNEGKTALFYAVQYLSKKRVAHELIDGGSDVNKTDNEGKTALFYAVQQRHNKGVVRELIQHGSGDVNITDNEGKTALFYAVLKSDNKGVVCELISGGTDVNITDDAGKTALFYAVLKYYNKGVVCELINAGADVNITDYEGKSPLFYALQKVYNRSMVNTLIDAGADVNIADNKGKTVLFFVVQQSNNSSMVNAFIDAGADVNKTFDEGKTALFYAIEQSHNEGVVRALIAGGADVNETDIKGKTALTYAIRCFSNESIVHALIDAGADVNIADNKGKTVLFFVVQQSNNSSMVNALIDAGADVNKTFDEGKTALFYAIERSDNEGVVRALIAGGADVNKTDTKGKTALTYAMRCFSDESIVHALIDAGADVNIADNKGKTALTYAMRCFSNESIVHALIDAGADVNIADNKGKTALTYAMRCFSDESIVYALIDAGADVNVSDNEEKTALFYAVFVSKNVVGALIDAGALLNARDHYGRTPLFYAIAAPGSLADYLLERGASLTILIDGYYKSELDDLKDRLKILVERKIVINKQILQAIIDVAFCNIFSAKETSCGVDLCYFSAFLRLATDYSSLVDVRKREAINTILKTINEQPNKLLIDPEVISKILSLLVKLGANPNSVDSDGNTSLHHAIQLSSYGVPEETVINICNQLKEMGASFHIKNLKKETPLLRCLVSLILKISSNHDCRQWSEVQTQLAVCQFLIKHGSNVEEKMQSGQSVFHLILELLQKVLLDEESITRCLYDLLRLLQNMLTAQKEKGLPTVIIDDNGNTPLHAWATFQLPPGHDYSSTIAERYTFKRLLKIILDHFIDENKSQLHVKNENGETSLHLCRTWTAVELLLDAGANPNDVDSSGRSPLLVAAKNSKLVQNRDSLYPDILLAQDEFWRMVLDKGLDPWKVDIHDESCLSALMKSQSHDVARALVHVACDDRKIQSRPLILFSLLTAICKDQSPDAQWKKDVAELILSSTKCRVNGNDREDSPLHYCCRNIVKDLKGSSTDETKSTVHWRMVKLLRSYGADYRIPDTTDKSCLDIVEEYSPLKDLLLEPIDLEKRPVLIKPWKSPVSKTHERCLAEVARHLESDHVKDYWYHKDHLACGSFGAVYAGINENDGREVAIKRIVKLRMEQPHDQREISSLTALADCEQVVRYLAFFEDKDFSYIVLELMEGNLEDLLNKSIAMKEREKLCFDVVKGLSHMHGKEYLHRDLKPTNILFKNSPQLCLKIADFGLSRRMDSTGSSTSVYGSHVGTRCWIAPEVIKSTKYQHSKASDMFSCGLVLHYVLSAKKHPFSPEDCAKGELQICNETERNIILDNKEGWDDSLSPEATNLLGRLLESDVTKRSTAAESLAHPLFWSKAKKMDVLIAVGNQPEFECPRARRTIPLTAVETDLEASFGTIFKYVDWNDPGYVHMPAIYNEMRRTGRRRYDTRSVVELVRFIRNAHAHVSESTRPLPIRKQLLEDFVFLKYFPNLVMEVYKAVTTHGWDQTREEIKYAMTK